MGAILPAAALILAAAAFPHAASASGEQAASDVEVIAATVDRNDRMTVPVRIGSAGPFRFLIDTGAQNTVISASLAEQLALVPSNRATLIGVAGRLEVETVEIDEIGLGGRSFYGVTAPILPYNDIGAQGIVGLDGLQGQRVLIDFTRNLIAIDDARRLGGDSGFEIVVSARRRSGQLIITRAKIDGVTADIVIDTGAEVSIGNRALQRSLARRSTSQQMMLTSVTGQQTLADIGSAKTLGIGSIEIRNIAIAYADAPAFGHLGLERRPAMLLGMRELRVFKRVAIDFSTQKVLFDMPSSEIPLMN